MLWVRSLQPTVRFLHNARRCFSASSTTQQIASFSWTPYRSSCVRLLSLNDLRDQKGALPKKKRVGRGPGSGIGKTCGRGTKGTYQRHRLRKRGFEGAHTPLWKATPKFGKKRAPMQYQPLSLAKLLMWVQAGRIDTSQVLTMKVLQDSHIFGNSKIQDGVKLLGRDAAMFKEHYAALGLPPPRLVVTDADEEGKKAIESVGGSVELRWMARLPLRAHFKPEDFHILPRSNGVPPKKLWEKYDFKFPEDRYYRGSEKAKVFSNRAVPKSN